MKKAPHSQPPPSAPSPAGGSVASVSRRPGASIPIPIARSPARPLAARVYARASAASVDMPSTPPKASPLDAHAHTASGPPPEREPDSSRPSPSSLPPPSPDGLAPYLPAPISRAAASLRHVGSKASLKLATTAQGASPNTHPSGPSPTAEAAPQSASVLGDKSRRPSVHQASFAPYRIPNPAAVRTVTRVTSARHTQPEADEAETKPSTDASTVPEPDPKPEVPPAPAEPAPRKRTVSWFGRRAPSPTPPPAPMPPVATMATDAPPTAEHPVESEAQQYLRHLRDGPSEPAMETVAEEANESAGPGVVPPNPSQIAPGPDAAKSSLLRSLFLGGAVQEPSPAGAPTVQGPASSDLQDDNLTTSTAAPPREARGADSSLRSGWVWPFWTAPPSQGDESVPTKSSPSMPRKEKPGREIDPMDITDVYYHPEAQGAENGTAQSVGSYLSSWLPGIPRWSADQEPSSNAQGGKPASDPIPEGLTPAEQIKRDALRRYGSPEQLVRTTNALRHLDQTPGSDVVARTTWMSLLRWSTPNRATLPSTEEHDGPEVMDLDADCNAPPPTPSPAPKNTTNQSTLPKQPKSVKEVAKRNLKQDLDPKSASTPSLVKSTDTPPAAPTPSDSRKGAKPGVNTKPASKPRKDIKVLAPPAPNLVAPSFEDTFLSPPRSLVPKSGVWERTMSYLFSGPSNAPTSSQGSPPTASPLSAENLPKAWTTLDRPVDAHIRRVVVVGVHGWFTQSFLKTFMGEPTGTSHKFTTMMTQAVEAQLDSLEVPKSQRRVTSIPLHGDGKVSERVDMLYGQLEGNPQWVAALRTADAVFVAAHSQGAVVSVHLLARMLEEGIVQTDRTPVCLLAMCGIHHGPFTHLQGNLASTYLHYFETAAAKELFEFQSQSSSVSQAYLASLQRVLHPPPTGGLNPPGVKILFAGSVDDQVVPLYSALNFSVDHPNVLRALYVNGQAFPQGQDDFLVHLLTFLVRIRNAGLDDHGLLALLSSAVAGSVFGGSGHSLIYDERAVYDLAVRYLFQVDLYRPPSPGPIARTKKGKRKRTPASAPATLEVISEERRLALTGDAFKNPYQLPWAFRGLLEDARIKDWFASELDQLIDAFDQWQPATRPLRDIQFRLQPLGQMRRLQTAQQAKARM